MRVTHEVPLAPMTTLGLGGPAAVLFELFDPADFPEFVALADASPPRRSVSARAAMWWSATPDARAPCCG